MFPSRQEEVGEAEEQLSAVSLQICQDAGDVVAVEVALCGGQFGGGWGRNVFRRPPSLCLLAAALSPRSKCEDRLSAHGVLWYELPDAFHQALGQIAIRVAPPADRLCYVDHGSQRDHVLLGKAKRREARPRVRRQQFGKGKPFIGAGQSCRPTGGVQHSGVKLDPCGSELWLLDRFAHEGVQFKPCFEQEHRKRPALVIPAASRVRQLILGETFELELASAPDARKPNDGNTRAQPVCCVRRWCRRRILSRLPQVDIEHQRRRPLVLRNSHPQPRPGQRLTRFRRLRS